MDWRRRLIEAVIALIAGLAGFSCGCMAPDEKPLPVDASVRVGTPHHATESGDQP